MLDETVDCRDYGVPATCRGLPLGEGPSLQDHSALISNRRRCRLEFPVTTCKQRTQCNS